MCRKCNYRVMLEERGLDPTPNRLRLLEFLGEQEIPLRASEIFKGLKNSSLLHRVTVYRILDLLVEKGLVEPLAGTTQGLVYGLAPNKNHPAHPHFQCRRCGELYCLKPLRSPVNLREIRRSTPGEVQEVKVLVSGICQGCLGRK